MSVSSNLDPRIEILKALGHKSRTLLNGITGPVQIIRSLSDDPKLIEPLRLLELSVSRFEKFSFRSLLLSDLIRDNKITNPKPFDLVEIIRYINLDLTDLLDFYNIHVDLQSDNSSIELTSDSDLFSHCIMILLEHIISLSNDGSVIKIEFKKNTTQADCTFTCSDNGSVFKSINTILSTADYPSDIDLYLLKLGLEVLNIHTNITLSSNNQSIIKLELP